MRKQIIITAVILAIGAAGFQACSSKGETLVKVNGKKITEGDLAFLSTINPNIAAQLHSPFGKKQILDNLVEQELLYQASLKEGVQNDSNIKKKIDLYRRVIIAQGYLDNTLEKDAKKYYDDNKNEFETLKLSQIMIRYQTPADLKDKKKKPALDAAKHTEPEALKLASQIRTRLDAGEDFEKVAKEVSEDKMTAGRGGDLGPVARDDKGMERRGYAPLTEKAFTMKVGEIAGPFKTDKGYHIIKVTEPAELKTFDVAKEEIERRLRGQTRQQVLADLKSKATIKYKEEPKVAEKPAMPAEPTKTPENGTPPPEKEQPNGGGPQGDQPQTDHAVKEVPQVPPQQKN